LAVGSFVLTINHAVSADVSSALSAKREKFLFGKN